MLNGRQQLWDFILVLANRDRDGTLRTRVLLCHPDWDEPVEIAEVQSNGDKTIVNLARSQARRA